MPFTVKQVVGRIGIYVASTENLHVRPQNIRRILALNHLNLHSVIPNMLRDYLMTYEPLATASASGWSNAYKQLDLASLTENPKEIQSVGYSGSGTTAAAAYKRAISLEHIQGLQAYDEEEVEGRYWFPFRGKGTDIGEGKIIVYAGSSISGETPLTVGFVREMHVNYITLNDYTTNKDSVMDCPSEAIEFLIMNTARDCIMEKAHKVPEYLGQNLQDQRVMLAQLDNAIATQLKQNEAQGVDVR